MIEILLMELQTVKILLTQNHEHEERATAARQRIEELRARIRLLTESDNPTLN